MYVVDDTSMDLTISGRTYTDQCHVEMRTPSTSALGFVPCDALGVKRSVLANYWDNYEKYWERWLLPIQRT